MLIGVLSDSHDNLDNLNLALKYLESANIEIALFCGDFCSPIPVKKCISNFTGTVHAVYGNTEDRYTITHLAHTTVTNLKVYGEFTELEFDKKIIAMTHYPEYAQGFAHTKKYDAVFYGHQHHVQVDRVGDTLLACPGEIMGAFEDPAFGIYDTEKNDIKILYLKDIPKL